MSSIGKRILDGNDGVDWDDPQIAAELEELTERLFESGAEPTEKKARQHAKISIRDRFKEQRRAAETAAEFAERAEALRLRVDAVDLDDLADAADPFDVPGAPDIAPMTHEAFLAEIAARRSEYGPEILEEVRVPTREPVTDEDRRRWSAGVYKPYDPISPNGMRDRMLDFLAGEEYLYKRGVICLLYTSPSPRDS